MLIRVLLGIIRIAASLSFVWICKEIVEQHGGDIGVASTAEAGTTFTVWLPQGDT